MAMRKPVSVARECTRAASQASAIVYDRAVISSALGTSKNRSRCSEKLLQDRPGRSGIDECVGIHAGGSRFGSRARRGLIHKALLVTPDSPAVLDSLGWVRFRQGDVKGAVRTSSTPIRWT